MKPDRTPDRSYVVFADDWGAHPSSCQHLFRRIARVSRTLWVNTVGLRPPRPTREDALRAARKLRRWIDRPARAADEGAPRQGTDGTLDLHAISPPMVPWMRPRVLRELNRVSVRRALRAHAARLGLQRPVVVTTVPNGVDAVGALDECLLVYYCVDDFTRWPGVDRAAAEQMERELLDRADVIVATSAHLARTRAVAGKPVHLLPHGVDLEHFARAADGRAQPLPGVRRGRPVLGYLGLLDERTDAALLRAVARARPGWDIALVGPVDRVPGELLAEPNVRALPAVPYERVPEALAAFDVAILPYARNELTDAINPLKLREYLASGRPVVATPLPEVRALAPHVRLAENAESFVRACESALGGGRDLLGERRELLARQGWEERAERFARIVDDALGVAPRGGRARAAAAQEVV